MDRNPYVAAALVSFHRAELERRFADSWTEGRTSRRRRRRRRTHRP
jgi:hypothetical protein